MLEAKDLRIGNLFHFPFTKEDVEILGINAYETTSGEIRHKISFKKDSNLYCETLEVLKPIPISEDWLIRFGFFIVNYNGIEATMPNKRCNIKNFKHYDGWFFCDGDTVLTNLQFVHTLQNLWFFMTTQELQLIN